SLEILERGMLDTTKARHPAMGWGIGAIMERVFEQTGSSACGFVYGIGRQIFCCFIDAVFGRR
ncbi:MAG: hypothetical protein PHF70_13450, partial [Opitutales bacterium]|nr:hypothetical protein [Opitutales bacterium]